LVRNGFALTTDQQVITDERECDRIVRQAPGSVNPSLEITGIDNTNSEHTENELAEALTEGSTGVAARRRGEAHEEAFDAGDVVSVARFRVGSRREVAADANSVLRSVWTGFVDGFEPDAEVVAGPSPLSPRGGAGATTTEAAHGRPTPTFVAHRAVARPAGSVSQAGWPVRPARHRTSLGCA